MNGSVTPLTHTSVPFSHSVMSYYLWPHELQHACPLSQWCNLTISSSVLSFSSCPQSFPVSGTFQWLNTSDQVAKVLQLQFQHQSFQWLFSVDFLWDWLVWSPCCPRDFQKSSPAAQFEGINSKPLFHSPHSPSSRGSLFPLQFLPFNWYHLHMWGCLYFSRQCWFQLVIHPACHFTWCTLHRS